MSQHPYEEVVFASLAGASLPRFAGSLVTVNENDADDEAPGGIRLSGETFGDCATLQKAVERSADQRAYFVFYPGCAEYIQTAVGHGGSPSQAGLDWCALMKDLLVLAHASASKVKLVERAAADADPRLILEVIGRTGNFAEPSTADEDHTTGPTNEEIEPSNLLVGELTASCTPCVAELTIELAKTAVLFEAEADRMARIRGELDAICSAGAADNGTFSREPTDAERSARFWRKKTRLAKAEIKNLNKVIRDTKETAKRFRKTVADAKTSKEKAEAATQKEKARSEGYYTRLMDKRARAKAEKQALEARLKEAEAELAKLRAEIKQARLDIGHAKGHLAEVYASTSWKVTSPLRTIGRAMKRSG
ncbi:MAG: hypothetical protein AAGH83_08290 [Pseudomonadota bacterium]